MNKEKKTFTNEYRKWTRLLQTNKEKKPKPLQMNKGKNNLYKWIKKINQTFTNK